MRTRMAAAAQSANSTAPSTRGTAMPACWNRRVAARGPAIRAALPNKATIVSKLTFNAAESADFLAAWEVQRQDGRDQAVLCGTEAHVCVLQSAAGLKARGAEVFVAADATGSRAEANKEVALERLAGFGVQAVTTEMAVFEWLGVAGTEEFRSLSKLIR